MTDRCHWEGSLWRASIWNHLFLKAQDFTEKYVSRSVNKVIFFISEQHHSFCHIGDPDVITEDIFQKKTVSDQFILS